MKKLWIAAGLAVAMSSTAHACNTELLSLVDWEAAENAGSALIPVTLVAKVQYNGSRPYRMIHAGVILADVLGEGLGQVNLNRDQTVSPGEVVEANGFVGAEERLLTVNRDDIVGSTCVWSIVYSDGQVEEF